MEPFDSRSQWAGLASDALEVGRLCFSDLLWGSHQRVEVPGHMDFVLLNLLFPLSLTIRELSHNGLQSSLLY